MTRRFVRNMTFALAFFATVAVVAQEQIDAPAPSSFDIDAPKTRDQMLAALANDASATSCEISDQSLICLCVELDGGITIDRWENGISTGYRRNKNDARWWIEKQNGAVAYTRGQSGFIAARRVDDTLEDVEFGQVKIGSKCGEKPTIDRFADADQMRWIEKRWEIRNYRENPIRVGNASDRPATGFLLPTLRAGQTGFDDPLILEFDAGFFLAPVRSAFVVNASNKWAGAGVAIPTKNSNEFRLLELQARYDFEQSEIAPFAAGNFHLGNRLGHVAITAEHPQPNSFSVTRQLTRDRLFRRHQLSFVGAALSGPAHSFHTALGALTFDGDTDVLMTVDYSTALKIGYVNVDLVARHVGDQRDRADDRLLQSTTLGAKLAHNFGKGWTLEPAFILGTNFGVVPIDAGYDASATGLVIGQLHARLPIVGRFKNAEHRLVPNLTAGRDLAGFQQRFLRDGTSPFPFRRRSGYTFGRAGIENTISISSWTFETPVSAHLFSSDETRVSGLAGIEARHELGGLKVTVHCESECATLRYFGNATFRASKNLSVAYSLSNLTAAQLVQELGERLHVGPSLPLLWTQNLPFVLEPDWTHRATVDIRFNPFRAKVTGVYDVAQNRGGGIVSIDRFWQRLGWGISAKVGFEPFTESWNSSVGFQGRFTP